MVKKFVFSSLETHGRSQFFNLEVHAQDLWVSDDELLKKKKNA